MDDISQRIEEIEREIRETPYHKGTQHHIGRMRARLAQLKDVLIDGQARRRQGSGGSSGFALRKHGDATVVLVGFPSVGKSTLLNALTSAKSRVAPYAFTTVTVIPGMMDYKGAKIQILDVPGLIEGASQGRGRGREVLSVIRSADLLIIMAEAQHEADFNLIKSELEENGVRINQDPPRVEIKKTLSGGLQIRSSVKQELSNETIRGILQQFRIVNSEVNIREKVSIDRLIDGLAKNRVWVPALFVVNKIDVHPARHRYARLPFGLNRQAIAGQAQALAGEPTDFSGAVAVSAEKRIGLDELREAIWEKLKFVRVYLRKPDGGTDYDEPLIIREGRTLKDVAEKIGTEFAARVKAVRIWGPGSHFPGQKVSFSTLVHDELEVLFL